MVGYYFLLAVAAAVILPSSEAFYITVKNTWISNLVFIFKVGELVNGVHDRPFLLSG